jgi:T4 RnlA family RNA ligase
MALLNSGKYKAFKEALYHTTAVCNHTVDLEWTSPNNRIVLRYSDDSLTVLSSQSRESIEIVDSFAGLNDFLVKKFSKNELQTIKNDVNIEGYVVEFSDKTRVKIKSEWYCILHKTKESITTPKNLYECCINEKADDLLSMFAGDDVTVQQIKTMQNKAVNDFNALKNTCKLWYDNNKDLDRKEYAIKTQKEFKDKKFGLCMSLYLQKEPDYVKYLLDSFE